MTIAVASCGGNVRIAVVRQDCDAEFVANHQHRGEEEEDIVLFSSPELLTVIERAKHQPASLDWEAELDKL